MVTDAQNMRAQVVLAAVCTPLLGLSLVAFTPREATAASSCDLLKNPSVMALISGPGETSLRRKCRLKLSEAGLTDPAPPPPKPTGEHAKLRPRVPLEPDAPALGKPGLGAD